MLTANSLFTKFAPKSLRFASLSTSVDKNLSYVHCASSIPLLPLTTSQILTRSTEKYPDRDVFVFPEQKIRRTYEQFHAEVRKTAAGFLATGLKRGDRIGIWAPNVYEWVLTQNAAAMAGLVLVNVNPAYRKAELRYALEKVGCAGIVSAMSFKSNDYMETIFELCPELSTCPAGGLRSNRLPKLRNVYMISNEQHPGCFKFSDLLEAGSSEFSKELAEIGDKIQPDDPVNIQFTSGTTGYPKGAVLSHHNIVNNANLGGHRMRLPEYDSIRVCCTPPLYHCFGCVGGALLPMVFGGCAVFPSASFQGLAALQSIENEKCTILFGTPTMFIDMLSNAEFGKYDYSTLKAGLMGGAPCPPEVVRAGGEKFPIPNLLTVYGATENSPVTCLYAPDDEPEKRAVTVGKALDHTELMVVSRDGKCVKRGEKGTLLARGYFVMLGYYKDAEKTAEVMRNGWYNTGDTATIDNEGYVTIVGRDKDMIIRGGENVYPTEIEQAFFEHPQVEDVYVVGVPDERMGEEICAWVKLREGSKVNESEMREFLKGKLAHFKIPKYLAFKTEFPMTATGKVQKFRIRDLAKKELGLEHVASHMQT